MRIIILSGTGLVLIAYLSLRPSPILSEIGWLPDWLTHWADRHGELRTGVPFFVLSSYWALEVWWRFHLSASLPALLWLLGVYGLGALLGLTELIQIPMPNRHFSWGDISWGMVGSVLGGWPLLLRHAFRDGSREKAAGV